MNDLDRGVMSPYVTLPEAAAYLRLTPKALYNLVERRRIVPLRPRGQRRLLFTREILDAYMKGQS